MKIHTKPAILNLFLGLILSLTIGFAVPAFVYADNGCQSVSGGCVINSQNLESGACTKATGADGAIQCSGIMQNVIEPIITFLGAGVGVIVVIMFIVGGIQYTTSGGSPQAAANARKRIFNAILALVTYIFLYALLNYIVPGGIKPHLP